MIDSSAVFALGFLFFLLGFFVGIYLERASSKRERDIKKYWKKHDKKLLSNALYNKTLIESLEGCKYVIPEKSDMEKKP